MTTRKITIRLGGGLLGLVVLSAGVYLYKNVLADTTPTITSISPSAGPTVGGQNVVIAGQNFDQFGIDTSTPHLTGVYRTDTGTNVTSWGGNGAIDVVIGGQVYNYTGTYVSYLPVANMGAASFTASGNRLPANCSVQFGSRFFQISTNLYLIATGAGQGICQSTTSDPTTWIDTGNALPSTGLITTAVDIVGGNIYLFGGSTNMSDPCDATSSITVTNKIYKASITDPTNFTDSGATLPAARCDGNYLNTGTYLYYIGGWDGTTTTPTNTILRASIANPLSWTSTGSFNTNTGAAATFIMGNTVYIIGGFPISTSNVYSATITSGQVGSFTLSTTDGMQWEEGHILLIGDTVYVMSLWDGVEWNGGIYSMPITGYASSLNKYNLKWQTNWSQPVTSVTFGGVPATNIEYFPSGTVLATTPAHTQGVVDVSVTGGTTIATLTAGYNYGIPLITYTNLAGSTADTQGGKLVTVTHLELTPGSTISAGGTPCGTVSTARNSVTCYVPAGHALTPIVIRDSSGSVIYDLE